MGRDGLCWPRPWRWCPDARSRRSRTTGVWGIGGRRRPLRSAEVDKYYRTQLNPDAPQPSQDEALSLKLNVLDELINNHILLEKAKKLGLQAADGEVEDKFTEFKSPYTEEEFQRQLKVRRLHGGRSERRHPAAALHSKGDQSRSGGQNRCHRSGRSGFLQSEPRAIQRDRAAIPHRADRDHSAQGSGPAQSQERRRHHRRRSQAQGRGPRAAAQHRRGLRAGGHGLFGRPGDPRARAATWATCRNPRYRRAIPR